MITIPETIKITRSPKAEHKLMEVSRTWIEGSEREPGIHASGLLEPRLEYWKQIDPRGIPDRLIKIFLIGKVLHSFVISSVDGLKTNALSSDEGGMFSEDLGIWFSPDKIINGVVREIKTSRKFSAPDISKGDLDDYIKQTLIYMAGTNTLMSQIWVLFINMKNKNYRYDPEFRCYNVTITEEQLKEVKKQIKATKKAIETAIKTSEFKELPLCTQWKCSRLDCDYFDKCKPEGRWKSVEDELLEKKAKKKKKRKTTKKKLKV